MNTFLSKGMLALGAVLTLCFAGTSARADNFLIVPFGPTIVQPAGLGTVNTVLVLQTKGSATSGFGSVAYDPNNTSSNRKGDLVSGNLLLFSLFLSQGNKSLAMPWQFGARANAYDRLFRRE